jgi:hypothetical protein
MLRALLLSSLGFCASNVFSSHSNGGHRFFSYTRTLGRLSGAGYSRPHLLHPSKKVNDGDKGGLISTELRDFRAAWDDEPERLNSKGKKQCGERQSLQKYTIPFSESESTEVLRDKMADFYAQRTLTFLPQDCAAAVVWLAGDQSAKTTGHVIPVDGGLSEMQPVPAM